MTVPDPRQCRQKLQALGLPYPKSGCAKCGSILVSGWRCAEEREQIEITPEMIEAGVNAVHDHSDFSAADLAVAVYRAMAAVDRADRIDRAIAVERSGMRRLLLRMERYRDKLRAET
jgi:hypothetical protein